MRPLVTGATGFIGLEVVRQLASAGIRPRVVVRRPSRAPLLNGLDVEPVHADLRDPTSLRRAVEGCDAVIHLAARATFEDEAYLRPTIVDGSVALARAAADAGVRTFVHASSLLVHGDVEGPIDRHTRPEPVIGYGRAKLAAEHAVADAVSDRDMAYTAIRLPHVYGARDHVFGRVRKGRLVVPGAGRSTYSHLHVADAATVLVEAARRGLEGAWVVADDDPMSWRAFFDVVATHLPDLTILHAPTRLALAGATAAATVLSRPRRPTLVHPDTVRGYALRHEVVDPSLWDALDLAPRHPSAADGIPAVLDDCVAFRWRHPVDDHRAA